MQRIPARYHHGHDGFDRRLMEDLAAVGVRCYTVQDLHGSPVTTGVIDVLADWLAHLDDRIPGPETHHRQAIRANLIKQLNRTSVRGNQRVFDLLIAQMLYDPPLPGIAGNAAGYAIAKIATRHDFERISALIDQLPPGVSRGALIEYMGKVKTDDARDIALSYLDTEWTYFSLKALISMRAIGVRERVEPYLDSPNAFVRKYARRAMEVLPR
ncbi:hypothetical protein A7U43_28470 (plasmid) [Mycobacterium adipatum]|uniref:Uncharacterized protein n=2 Tax=Mycobacterium adipatum TaxID=1682113 RepID=A0A172UWU3_9MYCO|nr:hypothetical protein A7U43_28470 [Mycobacterium adipatum]